MLGTVPDTGSPLVSRQEALTAHRQLEQPPAAAHPKAALGVLPDRVPFLLGQTLTLPEHRQPARLDPAQAVVASEPDRSLPINVDRGNRKLPHLWRQRLPLKPVLTSGSVGEAGVESLGGSDIQPPARIRRDAVLAQNLARHVLGHGHESVPLPPHQAHARSHPQHAVGGLVQRLHVGARQPFGSAEGAESPAIVAEQPVLAAHPKESLPVLQKAVGCQVGETLLGAEAPEPVPLGISQAC